MGRPKKNRKKAPEEKIRKDGAKTLTRGGLTMHCSICGKTNHNKKGHENFMQNVQANEVASTGEEEEEEEHDIPSILQVQEVCLIVIVDITRCGYFICEPN
jgi:hypothetical protein